VGSVIGDILLAILAARPAGLYVLPWIIIGTVMVGVKICFELYEERMAVKSGRPSERVRTVRGSGEIIRGRRQGTNADPDDLAISLQVYSFLFAVNFVVFGTIIMFGRIGLHGRPAVEIGLSVALIGWIILALLYRFAYGVHACLAVSADGVMFKGSRGRTLREHLFIRWTDVIDFTITEAEHTGGPWLAAIPPAGSPLIFHGPTARLYDAENNLILICNLDDAGIQKHVVTGALRHWRPVKTSKSS
jgi:hypothetical protein